MDSYPASPILEDPEGNIKVTIPKNRPLLGIVIEGGANTSQPLPRIVNIQVSRRQPTCIKKINTSHAVLFISSEASGEIAAGAFRKAAGR